MKLFSIIVLPALIGALAPLAVAANPDPARTRELLTVAQQTDAPLAARARALEQLALVASGDAAPALALLLTDARLGYYARDVLEQMPDPRAVDALRAALPHLTGSAQIGVINSLGVRRDGRAVEPLNVLAISDGAPTTEPALLALGRIATPEAVRYLERALTRRSAPVRTAAAEGALLAADRLLTEGKQSVALALFQAVRSADLPAPLHLTATRGTILADPSRGLALLLDQLRSADLDARDLALLTLRDLPGPKVTATLIAELDHFAPPLQALVLAALVDRGEAGVVAAVEARARSGPPEVRLAAVQALGRIGRDSSVPLLLETLRPAENRALVEAALVSLARLTASGTDLAILQAQATMETPLRVRLIALLGERKSDRALPDLLRLAQDPDLEIAKAALRAVGLIANPSDLPALIQLALSTTDEAAKTLADRAIVTASMKVLDPAGRADAALLAFRQASLPETKAALLRPLGAIVRSMGSQHEVFFAVRAALTDPAAPVRAAALQTLADWPDATPTTTLLDLANRPGTTPDQRETALRGAIRMAGNVAAGRERSPLNILASFTSANRAVRTKAEKLMIVSGLGSLKRPESLAMLQPYLDDPDVRSEAALAVVQIAPALLSAKDHAAIVATLDKISANDPDPALRQQAATLAKRTPTPPKIAVAPAGSATAKPAGGASDPILLFNATDLATWDGDPGVWRVRDGAIVGGSLEGNPRNEFLATTKRYKDFVLRLDYKLVGTTGFVNGGVQFRSVRIAQPPNEMVGYQADIGAGHSGCLYDESRRKNFLARATDEQIKRLEKPGDWNHYEVRCEGPHIEITLNGEKTVAYTEVDPSVPLDGLIALQIHGNCRAEISYRNLTLELLP